MRIAGAIAAAAILGAAGWFGAAWYSSAQKSPRAALSQPVPAAPAAPSGADVVAVESVGPAGVPGATPMRERVAVIGLLNKRNGVSRDLTMKPGQAVRTGDTVVRLRACERTAPWEQQTLTGAFVQLDVNGADKAWRRAFSGWLFKERPQLNVVLHPVYDVWVKSCTMSYPASGPDTVTLGAPSSAKKSPSARADADEDEVPSEPVAAASNAR